MIAPKKIWLPGRGVVDLDAMKIHKAVQEYDERLMFGRNEDTGDWCVFVKMPHGQAPIAVIGFGRELPRDPREVVARCDQANTRKYGTQILDRINKDNEERNAKLEWAAARADEVGAELLADLARLQGFHPGVRIFVPKGVK